MTARKKPGKKWVRVKAKPKRTARKKPEKKWVRVKAKPKRSQISPSRMFVFMTERLEKMAGCIRGLGIDADFRSWLNRDKTIDGWVRVGTMPHSSTRQILLTMGKCINPFHREIWMSAVALFPMCEGVPVYARFQGMNQIQMYWMRTGSLGKVAKHWADFVKAVERMQRRWRYKPIMVKVLYHWNRKGHKPKRKGGNRGY